MLKWIGVGVLVVATIVFGAGVSLIRSVHKVVGPSPQDLDAQTVEFSSPSGARIRGWLARGRPGAGAVLLLHGVRADRRAMLPRALFLHDAGFTVLLIDLQAHGESDGGKITFGYLESRDALAAVEFLKGAAPGERIGVIGVSLGAASAVLGSPLGIDALVAESMYPTIDQAIADRLAIVLGAAGPVFAPLLVWQIKPLLGFSSSALRPIDKISQIGAPLLLIHGVADGRTTIQEARAIFERASVPKEIWEVERAGHVDMHAANTTQYERRVLAFFKMNLAASN